MYVRPDQRRRGWGGALTAAVTETLIKRGIETVFLNVRQNNPVARLLYERLGYSVYCEFAEGFVDIT